jgi:hypothetical protein
MFKPIFVGLRKYSQKIKKMTPAFGTIRAKEKAASLLKT